MYILDTNVVSELRKAATNKANLGVLKWATSVHAGELFISVISVMEIDMGILAMERKDKAQGKKLRTWFEQQVLPEFDGRILNIDYNVVRACAKLHIPDRKSERDALIAATALTHSMTVVTSNTEDFKNTGVLLIDPWQ